MRRGKRFNNELRLMKRKKMRNVGRSMRHGWSIDYLKTSTICELRRRNFGTLTMLGTRSKCGR